VNLLVPGFAGDAVRAVEQIRAEMEENFHLYEEVRALPTEDRDALFRILWEAQSGDPDALSAVYDLVYEEVPVAMDQFIEDPHFLGLKGNIDPAKLDILVRFAHPHVRKMWCAAGSGSGKSFMVSIAMAYIVYATTCLRRPDLFYMLGPGSRIALVNLSVSKEQARDVIFAEFLARISTAPWFAGKYKAMTARARFSKRVYVLSGGSSATSYYGYHTLMGSMDEACFMLDKTDHAIAEDLAEALLKSLSTRFPRAYKLFVISSLRSPEDFLMTQIERVRDSGVRLL
jgi:hypothetical protein